jgi:hypothetical protein
MVSSLDPLLRRLLIATVDDALAGWLVLSGNDVPLTSHWAFVQRVQTALAVRGSGVGQALMVRGGAGLEDFYESIGWTEVGRWPGSLRFGDDDYRDNVLMALSLESSMQQPCV